LSVLSNHFTFSIPQSFGNILLPKENIRLAISKIMFKKTPSGHHLNSQIWKNLTLKNGQACENLSPEKPKLRKTTTLKRRLDQPP
jgi:hypothetical protein